MVSHIVSGRAVVSSHQLLASIVGRTAFGRRLTRHQKSAPQGSKWTDWRIPAIESNCQLKDLRGFFSTDEEQ